MTTLTTASAAGVTHAPPLPNLPFSGRGLHIGVTHQEPGLPPARWSNHSWDNLCAQAKTWGIDVIHPKVGEVVVWYNDTTLQQMIIIAHNHGIRVVPYIWCSGGNNYNADVQLAAHIGKIFGCVILDMEDPWFHQPIAMNNFGPQVRKAGYNGPLVPTTYANCTNHWEFPYMQMNAWAAAWMPQAYWNLWTFPAGHPQAYHPMSAFYALNDFLFPQWVSLDKSCMQTQHKPLAPILPIIGLTKNTQSGVVPAQGEVANWLKASQHYGYCGFWYEGAYAPYAQTILHAPHPELVHPAPAPAPAPAPKPPAPAPAPKPAPTPVTPPPLPVVHPGPVVTPPPAPTPVVSGEMPEPVSEQVPIVQVPPAPIPVEETPTVQVPIVQVPPTPAPAPTPAPELPSEPESVPLVVPNPVTPVLPVPEQTPGEIEQTGNTGEIAAPSALESLAQMLGQGITESAGSTDVQPAITSFTPELPAQPDAWLNDTELKSDHQVNHVVIFGLDEVVSVFFDGKVFKLYLHLAEQS